MMEMILIGQPLTEAKQPGDSVVSQREIVNFVLERRENQRAGRPGI